MRNANAIVVVFDLTSKDGLVKAESWIQVAKRESSARLLVLVGSKVDLIDERVLARKAGEEMALKHGMMYAEASAKTGENVNEMFQRMGSSLVMQDEEEQDEVKEELESVTLESVHERDDEVDAFCQC